MSIRCQFERMELTGCYYVNEEFATPSAPASNAAHTVSAVSLVFTAILSRPLSDSVVHSENVLEILAF